ncbi:hypothetical protein [Pantanalinema sp. GBBB05]|uniref:hypothetical protein n=1 Tax=Pantanalinema sp. GBBB05 TaxID=2604139 RepID=UPI001DDF314E|nr:hypothetical protein [Pantanalinema sp. GBBB05]
MVTTDLVKCFMEPVAQQEGLQRIAQRLQEDLQLLNDAIPVQIQCVLKQGSLMVLGQHPAGTTLDPAQVFGTLEQAIATLPPDFTAVLGHTALPSVIPTKLYLRVLGQKQPYTFHTFEFVPKQIEPEPIWSTDLELNEPTVVESSLDSHWQERNSRKTDLNQGSTTSEPIRNEYSVEDSHSLVDANQPSDMDLAEPPSFTPSVQAKTHSRSAAKSFPWLIVAGGLGAVVMAGAGFLVSRPCVIGTCEPLQTAQQVSQQAAELAKTAKSPAELAQIQQQLATAQQSLSGIPTWSGQYGTAQALRQSLAQVTTAEQQAESAQQKMATIPQPLSEWQATQVLWQQAIAQMQAIPPENTLHTFAQERLASYQQSLAAANKLMAIEQRAAKQLQSAKETGQVAEARQGIAQALQDWQLVQSTWQVAINTLKQVPQMTTSYGEAQQLQSDYQAKLAAVRSRTGKEQLAGKSYSQAVKLASQATTKQQQNQWSQAVGIWRQAIAVAKRVPAETTQYAEAQNLVTTYSTSLQQAENLVRVRTDLEKACAAINPRICNYKITNDLIKVTLTQTYQRTLRAKGYLSYSERDYDTWQSIRQHLKTLEDALQIISDNAGLPIEVYAAGGSELIGSFSPGGSNN